MANTKIQSEQIEDDIALGGNPTTTTQSAGNNTTRVATTAFVTTAVANLVDSAPSALDTLNELAAAMGDDASFSTTITNSIATKLPLAGGTMTGDIAHASDFTIDAGGDIILDADGADIILKDGGTQFGKIGKGGGSDLIIDASIADKDIFLTGTDGSSAITALTLDMSEAGKATFNAGGAFNDDVSVFGSDSKLFVGESGAGGTFGFLAWNDSSNYLYLGNSYNSAFNTDLVIDSSGNIGIGLTSSIASALHVNPEISLGADSNNRGIINYSSDILSFGTRQSSTNYFNTIKITGGQVGINRTPSISNSKLEVGGADDVSIINVEASGNTGGLGIGSTGLKVFHGSTNVIRVESHGTTTFNGELGAHGYTIPYDQTIGYSNNLNAGAFSILHRSNYDSYIVGNAYYYKTGGTAGWRAKYGSYKSNYISMLNGEIRFHANSSAPGSNGAAITFTEMARFDSDGLKFNADTAEANALDDYEEGTFNATIISENGSITADTSDDLCFYTKIGRLVTVQGRIAVGSVSNPSGQLYVGGFPFNLASAGETSHGMAVVVNIYNAASNFGGQVVGEMTTTGGARILIRGNGGTTSAVHTAAANIDSGSLIGFTATYPAT